MAVDEQNGLVTIASAHAVQETIQNLEAIFRSKGITIFALIDHSGEAEKAGMQMRNTKLMVFGSPKAGTPLMIAAPSLAIDLPLKVLISEDAEGKVWISYNSTDYLQARHHVPEDLMQKYMGTAVEQMAAKAAAPTGPI